jgi:phage/plasmid-like protein (TIGR03299 family)
MPAAVEVSVDGFEAAFAARNEPAWHQLGTVFDGEVDTAEMLRLAHLAKWNVRLVPVEVPGVIEERFALEQYATVRDNPFDGKADVLGFVGGRYKVSQNEEILSFGDNLLDGGGRWETAGSLHGGRKIFASLAMDYGTVLDPQGANDEIKSYLLVTTSHDGSSPIMALNTPVRVVCQNTLNLGIAQAKQSYKIRHTATLEGRIAVAREALGISQEYFAKFGDFAKALYEVKMDTPKFIKFATKLYPKPEKDSAKSSFTRWENKIDLLGDLFTGSGEVNTSANIGGTAWAGFNALTEALDWYRKPRKGSAESVVAAASGFDPVINAEKARITKAFATLVK